MESIKISINEDIITLICDYVEELGCMNPNELEEFVYENTNIPVAITPEMFIEFKQTGRLDIKVTIEEKVTVEQQGNSSLDPFKEANGKKEEYSKTNTITDMLSVFESEEGVDAGTILMRHLCKKYGIWEAKIKRGKSCYHYITVPKESGVIQFQIESIGIIEINLLEKIATSVRVNSTGMDSRKVRNYMMKKVGNEYHLILNCIFDDGDGDVTGIYRLRELKEIKEEIRSIITTF